MTDTAKTLTTTEFSKISGLSVSTITKMLRQGKLRGEKRSGKWALFETELQHHAPAGRPDPNATAAPVSKKPPVNGDQYEIENFARMTYLTEEGVRKYLNAGRLTGGIDANGRLMVDAANLERPELAHLIRK